MTMVDQALALAPEQVDYLTLRGQILVALLRPLDASEAWHLALSIDPFHAPARREMAELYLAYSRERDAAAEYDRYLTLAPEDAAGWFALGQIREAQDRPLEAIAAYSRTLELEPTHSSGLERRGALWLGQDNYLAAWADYTGLINTEPSADAYLARGAINLELEFPLLAAADLEAGLALLPEETQSYSLTMQIGQAYLQGGAPIEAAAAFSEAISLTTSIEPHLWLGKSYRAAGDYAAAVDLYDAIHDRITPLEAEELLVGRGEAHLVLGNYDAAISDLSYALYYVQDLSQEVRILEWRSAAYAALEAYEEAIADLSAAFGLIPSPSLLYSRGLIHHQTGDDENAIADLTQFLETADPEDTDADQFQEAQNLLDSLTAGSP
jgi:tetratricopeptide (TPR) repeat protein